MKEPQVEDTWRMTPQFRRFLEVIGSVDRAIVAWDIAREGTGVEHLQSETGWLIEEDAGGFIHWIALAENAWPRTELRDRRLGARSSRSFERYLSPVQRVKDSNDALRFARKEDAEAFIKLFDRFLLNARATEHEWPAALNSVGQGG